MGKMDANRPACNEAKGEKVFSLAEFKNYLSGQKDPNGEILTEEDIARLIEIGLNKGLPLELEKGEILTFSKNAWIKLSPITLNNGKSYDMLYIFCTSNLKGEIEFPIAIFRRYPHLESARKTLEENNQFFVPMLYTKKNDLERAFFVDGHQVKVSDKLRMKKLSFIKGADGLYHREDDADVENNDKAATSWFYKFEFVK